MEQDAIDAAFMQEAIEEARQAAEVGEVPVGAVVVRGGQVIARAHNAREIENDPSAHAELVAMREAARLLRSWRLTGCTVYVTLEPCFMCAGAIVNARPDRVVFGAMDPKAGAVGSLANVLADERLNHRPEVTAGVLAEECGTLLRDFFRAARSRRREAEGESARPLRPDP
ncbi:MAG: tRNA adenosine(34) deaminase TadA [Planctomycetota bacterium]|nr:tRNA adenosine(34) deaminase TadA [Planctomycetota bacterium]